LNYTRKTISFQVSALTKSFSKDKELQPAPSSSFLVPAK